MSAHVKHLASASGAAASSAGYRGLWALGGLGMVIGAAVAVAKNIRLVKEGKMQSDQAVGETLKESLGTGLTTAAAGAAAGVLGLSGALGLVGVAALGVGVKYLWDSALTPPAAAPAKPAAKASAKAETKPKAKAKAVKAPATAREE
ncbi:hypothetical protein Deba_0549 [Desulfarculus baarsii DSM 2075]|uniref:Uncharacterized protein n=1 Tax=Desulfarculus baarsii (strain ATCC 33931 / DSM 2075 / LMG 7858 / VKM B-1802 / 2st14) TaxID=644282 RepID=E1QED5_DESB2|nr:magnetosome protein MamC [Desulfarculus baarsii]ADK83921.1 hypothetical protein Deba_0549 [Desulfarculus baarsii DSM 2075]